MQPKISVLIPVFNDAEGLRKTLCSLRKQTISRDLFEIILVDGCSTDSTPIVIDEFSNIIDTILIERDSGISEAFNKLIALSTAPYIWHLNAGDICASELTIQTIVGILSENESVDVVQCSILCEVEGYINPNFSNFHITYDDRHQSLVLRKSLLQRIGQYSPLLKLRMDLELCAKLNKVAYTTKKFNVNICVYAAGGRSNQIANRVTFHREAMIIFLLNNDFKNFFAASIRYLYWSIRLALWS